jgi:hypothetical protein
VADGTGRNALVEYSDLRLALGVELATERHVTTLEVAYIFDRDIAVEETTFVTPGDTLMVGVTSTF